VLVLPSFVAFGDGLLKEAWLYVCCVQGRWSRKSHAALEMWWSVHLITATINIHLTITIISRCRA
jgi:hypothetical protein